jgi:cytochrome c oxidase subunit 4
MTDHDSGSHHDQASHAEGHHDQHGHGGVGKYLLVFLALCVLTSASFFTVSPLWPFHDTPQVGWMFMMAVSCTKAMLVISFFMHLIWEANWEYVLTIPATIMSIFLVMMLVPDIGERTMHYSGARWLHAAQPREVHHGGSAEEGHADESGEHAGPHEGDEPAGAAHP